MSYNLPPMSYSFCEAFVDGISVMVAEINLGMILNLGCFFISYIDTFLVYLGLMRFENLRLLMGLL